MNILLTAIKSMLWGFIMLFLLIVGFFEANSIDYKISKILPNEVHAKVLSLGAVIEPKLKRLENFYDKNEYKGRTQLRDEINGDIKTLCNGCKLEALYATSGWDVSLYRLYIERRMDPQAAAENNLTYSIAALSSAMLLGLCIYLIAGLICFRNNVKKVTTLISFSIPIGLTLFACSALKMDEKSFYQIIGDDNKLLELFIYSIVYVFVGYPAIYAVTKKKWESQLKR